MRAVIQAAIGKAEEEPIVGAIGDDNATSRRLAVDPRRQRSGRHALKGGRGPGGGGSGRLRFGRNSYYVCMLWFRTELANRAARSWL